MRSALWPDSDPAEIDALVGTADQNASTSAVIILVAQRPEGGLRGFAELGTRRYAEGCRSSPVAYLEGIWVDPDARRQGVASDLVRAAEGWARSLGLSEMASDCLIGNDGSLRFHLVAGFEEVERIVCLKKEIGPSVGSCAGPSTTDASRSGSRAGG